MRGSVAKVLRGMSKSPKLPSIAYDNKIVKTVIVPREDPLTGKELVPAHIHKFQVTMAPCHRLGYKFLKRIHKADSPDNARHLLGKFIAMQS